MVSPLSIKGEETCPPLFAKQKGDAASVARRRGFIQPHV